MLLLNYCYTTVSGHFFAICMLMFHKTEVQTVILICSIGINLNWFKSYGIKCSLRPNATLATHKEIATDKWPFYDHFWPFFVNYINIFHKTDVQKVSLRSLTDLNPNLFKSYDTKSKYFHFRFL